MKIKIIYKNDTEAPEIPRNILGAWEIASWIADDIQNSIQQIDELIEQYIDCEGQKNAGICYIGTGNAHSLYACEDYLYLECDFDEEQKVLLTTVQMLRILDQYKTYIQNGCKPCIIEVEYIAEGHEAEKQFLKMARINNLSQIKS